jgi:Glutathione S-transferase, N-terminal domain
MKVYWAPRTRSLRALWVLEEAGVPYEGVRPDLAACEQKSAEFRAINPMVKVPATFISFCGGPSSKYRAPSSKRATTSQCLLLAAD